MNRLTRDQVLNRALDMVDSPILDAKERVGTGMSATINASAMSIGWLQDGLDYFIHKFPFGGTLASFAINLVAGTGSYSLPSDYVQDYQNGVIYASSSNERGRLRRRGYNSILDFSTLDPGKPVIYAIAAPFIYFRPVPAKAYSVALTYYKLPAVLAGSDVPNFPSDLILVRYVYLRGLEWCKAVPPGTAEKYAADMVADLQRQGIGIEQESDRIPFDRGAFPGSMDGWGSDPTAWMGDPVA